MSIINGSWVGGRKIFRGLAVSAAFLFVAVIFAVSCIFDVDVPPEPTAPKIPHPLWVFYGNEWQEYNQRGEKVYWKRRTSNFHGTKINASTGDIWFSDMSGSLYIYDATGDYRNSVFFDNYVYDPAFNTKDKVVWICQCHDWEEPLLTALNYKGETLKTKRVPDILYVIDVYEAEGEVWGVTLSGVSKFNKTGEPIFSKTAGEIGFEYAVRVIFADQTDGGVWLAAYDAPYFLKLDRSGERVQTIDTSGIILDVGRKTGNVLANVEAEPGVWKLSLFDKSGSLLWRRGRSETGYWRGLIADFDGGCWYVRTQTGETDKVVLGKFNEAGEHIVKDVVVGDSGPSYSCAMWNDPYPYR